MTTDHGMASTETEHRVEWGSFGWRCSCGRGREAWLTSTGRARAAAQRHQFSEWRKAYRRSTDAELSAYVSRRGQS